MHVLLQLLHGGYILGRSVQLRHPSAHLHVAATPARASQRKRLRSQTVEPVPAALRGLHPRPDCDRVRERIRRHPRIRHPLHPPQHRVGVRLLACDLQHRVVRRRSLLAVHAHLRRVRCPHLLRRSHTALPRRSLQHRAEQRLRRDAAGRCTLQGAAAAQVERPRLCVGQAAVRHALEDAAGTGPRQHRVAGRCVDEACQQRVCERYGHVQSGAGVVVRDERPQAAVAEQRRHSVEALGAGKREEAGGECVAVHACGAALHGLQGGHEDVRRHAVCAQLSVEAHQHRLRPRTDDAGGCDERPQLAADQVELQRLCCGVLLLRPAPEVLPKVPCDGLIRHGHHAAQPCSSLFRAQQSLGTGPHPASQQRVRVLPASEAGLAATFLRACGPFACGRVVGGVAPRSRCDGRTGSRGSRTAAADTPCEGCQRRRRRRRQAARARDSTRHLRWRRLRRRRLATTPALRAGRGGGGGRPVSGGRQGEGSSSRGGGGGGGGLGYLAFSLLPLRGPHPLCRPRVDAPRRLPAAASAAGAAHADTAARFAEGTPLQRRRGAAPAEHAGYKAAPAHPEVDCCYLTPPCDLAQPACREGWTGSPARTRWGRRPPARCTGTPRLEAPRRRTPRVCAAPTARSSPPARRWQASLPARPAAETTARQGASACAASLGLRGRRVRRRCRQLQQLPPCATHPFNEVQIL
eukprot:Rhum_TRINITY_DN13955_c0_g2::Rhum_TRINITY_DN13955_c0_g2_i2::g.66231::m.66231